MSFNDNIRLDPTRVGTSGAGRKVAGVGGGSLLGLLLVLGFSYVTGIDLTSLLSSPSASSPSSSTVDVSTCRTGADANARVECRMVATAQSLDQVWKTQLTQQGTNVAYELPDELGVHRVRQRDQRGGPLLLPGRLHGLPGPGIL